MPYPYGKRSKTVRHSLHPDLKVLVDELARYRNTSLYESIRTNARQDQLFADGKTKVKAGGSKHNPDAEGYSRAIDMIPYPFAIKDWEDRDKFHLFAGYVLAIADRLFEEGKMTMRVRWGGDWDKDWEASDNDFDDFPHFELIW